MTATREHALQQTIEAFFGKRSQSNISYGTIRRRLQELDRETVIDRNGVAVLLEESPQKLTKLLKHNPPKSPFKPGKTPKTTIEEAIKWHDSLIAMKLAEPRTGAKWADPETSIARTKAKLPINYRIKDGNTIIYGIVLSEEDVYKILKNRGLIRWMTLRDAVEHPYWEHQMDRVHWAEAYAEHERGLWDTFVSNIQHSVLKQGLSES